MRYGMNKQASLSCLSVVSLMAVLLLPTNVSAYEAPYNASVFREVLKKSKLQFPNKKQIDFASFRGIGRANFYLSRGRYMTFKARKRHKKIVVRSELRFGPQGWKVSSSRSKLLKSEFALAKPRRIKQITILQIHAENPSVPPLRVVWLRRHKGVNDHIWAIVRPSPHRKAIQYVDLGKRPKHRFMRVSISVKKNRMKIWVNKRLKTSHSLARWKGTVNYYKAGIYLSGKRDTGMATVRYRLLQHKV
ncbi:MAG: polysaccharide lyase family 7 protein [Cocleimonas sp.]|nr:polysaccharide lyase family 7 protein [Cocleimonas sp.]